LFDIWFPKCPYFNVIFNCCLGVEDEGIFGRMTGIFTETLLHFFFSDSFPGIFPKMPSLQCPPTAVLGYEGEAIFGRIAMHEERGVAEVQIHC
jgi:hypothetical protein